MTGVEIDFVVPDCIAALALYERIFEVEHRNATALEKGSNEATFAMYGSLFHILDENPDYMLFAPKEGQPQSMWLNVTVSDITACYAKAIAAGCMEIQPVTLIEAMGLSNALFKDPFGYVWMLHQIHREVSFEDRVKIMTSEK